MDIPWIEQGSFLSSYQLKDSQILTIEMGKTMGRGTFGVVFAGTLQDAPVALRREFMGDMKQGTMDRFRESLVCRARVQHLEHVVRFLGFYREEDDIVTVILELCEHGEITNFLQRKCDLMDRHEFDELKLNLICQAAQGIGAIHEAGIAHRDIKPRKILISGSDSNPVVKIGGFSLAMKLESANLDPAIVGTPAYLPIGDFQNEGRRDCVKSDVYAFGITCWSIWTLKQPYQHLWNRVSANSYSLLMEIARHNLRPPLKGVGMPRFLSDLCQRCWSANPDERPLMSEVVDILTEATRPDLFVHERIEFLSTVAAHQLRVVLVRVDEGVTIELRGLLSLFRPWKDK